MFYTSKNLFHFGIFMDQQPKGPNSHHSWDLFHLRVIVAIHLAHEKRRKNVFVIVYIKKKKNIKLFGQKYVGGTQLLKLYPFHLVSIEIS